LTDDGQYEVPNTEIPECPVSYVSPKAQELVQIFNRGRHAHENSGVGLFGHDLSKWPAWAVDAVVVIEQERIKAENARFEAEKQQEP
jgi:hypothetical protein